MVERDLAKVEVASSTLVSRSNIKSRQLAVSSWQLEIIDCSRSQQLLTFISGGVAKW